MDLLISPESVMGHVSLSDHQQQMEEQMPITDVNCLNLDDFLPDNWQQAVTSTQHMNTHILDTSSQLPPSTNSFCYISNEQQQQHQMLMCNSPSSYSNVVTAAPGSSANADTDSDSGIYSYPPSCSYESSLSNSPKLGPHSTASSTSSAEMNCFESILTNGLQSSGNDFVNIDMDQQTCDSMGSCEMGAKQLDFGGGNYFYSFF
jgi:hypothetical protein